MRVITAREFHLPLAEIWYPPLAWCLVSSRSTDPGLGSALTAEWADATAWARYGDDTVTDLRNVAGRLPAADLPQFGAEEWVVLSGDTMTAVEGRPRPR